MKLPIPYDHGKSVMTDIEFSRPKAGLIAEVKRIADDADAYSAMVSFIAGSATITSEEGDTFSGQEAKAVVRAMPYLDAEWCSIKLLLLTGASDYFEGMSVCPRCGHRKSFDGEISKLPVLEAEAVQLSTIELGYPVRIMDEKSGDVAEEISSMSFRPPTLGDCIKAAQVCDVEDQLSLQYAVYAEALRSVNGREVADKWRGEWALQVINRMDPEDLRAVAEATHKYGLVRTIPLRCSKCKRTWDGEVDTSGFFSSGLHGR